MSPDGSPKPPPEEKLLKLIRGKTLRGGTESAEGSSPPSQAVSISLAGLPGAGTQRWRWPLLAAVGLGLVLGLELSVLVAQMTRPLPTVQMPSAPPASVPQAVPDADQPSEELPSLAASVSRPLFAVVKDEAPSAQPVERAGPSRAATELAARLTLMGVVSGEQAQAIIEDTQTKKSYFVQVGQAVVEGAVLDQILDNRVILNFEGEQIELTL
ncbi:MAG: type II secretion system protein N [Candidatus Omnitrophota bacterium]|nr:type II secretion system protein N [Candidatus Omnitrophota bacterium]